MTPLLLTTLLLSSVLQAAAPECSGSPADWLDTLTQGPDKTAYLCLAYQDAAYDPLLAAATADQDDGDVANRMTRAMAAHLILRLDRALTADEIRALNAADRRLLRDAVYARRGRATPSKAHAAVFELFDWYQPDPRFTNGRLTDMDRQNLDLLDNPPPELPREEPDGTAADAVAEAQQGPIVPKGMCGCSSAVGAGLAPWLLGLWAVARRRRDYAAS